MLSNEEPGATVKHAARLLAQLYDNLSHHKFDAQSMETQARQFALLYVSLEKAVNKPPFWRFKPKFHMMIHLCSSHSNPSQSWTYRDEDFGGSCATMARRRGGLQKPGATSANLLTKIRIKNQAPRIR